VPGFKVAEITLQVILSEFINARIMIQAGKIMGLFGPGETDLWITREVAAYSGCPASWGAYYKKIRKME
jgi:ABC-type microcin C transport system permease subunit YejE